MFAGKFCKFINESGRFKHMLINSLNCPWRVHWRKLRPVLRRRSMMLGNRLMIAMIRFRCFWVNEVKYLAKISILMDWITQHLKTCKLKSTRWCWNDWIGLRLVSRRKWPSGGATLRLLKYLNPLSGLWDKDLLIPLKRANWAKLISVL